MLQSAEPSSRSGFWPIQDCCHAQPLEPPQGGAVIRGQLGLLVNAAAIPITQYDIVVQGRKSITTLYLWIVRTFTPIMKVIGNSIWIDSRLSIEEQTQFQNHLRPISDIYNTMFPLNLFDN